MCGWSVYYSNQSGVLLTVKKQQSKAEIRAHLEREMSLFERDGGMVTKVPRGISGNDATQATAPSTRRLFLEPSVKRTHVPEVVAAIEARRKEKLVHKSRPVLNRKPRRKQKTIYDDFGEAVRTVWVEE